MSIELLIHFNHLSLCRPLLLLPSIFPSIRVFSSESVLHIRWPKYWSFSFSISPSNEYSGLISFRIVWLDLLAVWGTLKGLLHHHSSKASILLYSAFFIVQLSHPYMTTGKTIFNNRMGKTRDLFKKIRDTKGAFHAKSWLIGKDSDAGRDWGQEEKRTTEDEMAGLHHQLDGHEFGWWTARLGTCNSWGHKESDRTERLNWTERKINIKQMLENIVSEIHNKYLNHWRDLVKKEGFQSQLRNDWIFSWKSKMLVATS